MAVKLGVLGMTACIEWTGSRSPAGYGRFNEKYGHRMAWEEVHGPIPGNMYVCHHCDNPACVNVDHLFLGTAGDNARDMAAKGRVGGGPPKGVVPPGWARHKPDTWRAHDAGTCTRGHSGDDLYRYQRGPREGRVAYCRACLREKKEAARG